MRADDNSEPVIMTANLIEAEILEFLLPEFDLTDSVNESDEMTLVIGALISYQNIQVKNQMA